MDNTLDHKIRNLLAIVIGYARLMEEDMAADDRHRGDLQEILAAAVAAIGLLSAAEEP
ncbi:MAG TPA: hypothetical protein VNJ03_10400 [Vicinamibacterales bacterium]|nr:hypothetical protein [Vicinamibacterales bacterium]